MIIKLFVMTTKITIPAHLREYLIGKYCDFAEDCPVRFPESSDLYHTIYDLLEKRPASVPVDKGNLEIFLPHRTVGKSPHTYNYLGRRSQSILVKRIEVKMWAELHDALDTIKHRNGGKYIEGIHLFMSRYGITSLSEDAFLKNYYRWRSKERKKDVKRKYSRKNNTEKVA